MPVIPILLYHSVTSASDDWIAPYTVTPRDFAEHVDLILASGRTAMTVSDLHDALEGRSLLPERPVVITFDDGFADFTQVSDVLAAHDLPSTLYITTGALAGRAARPAGMALPPAPMLDWSQLPDLADRNVEIGGHTHTHPQLDTLRTSVASDEIRRCKHLLEDELGHEVRSFAYPHGFHSARIVRAVEGAGYRSACAVMDALSSEADRAFALARLTVRSSTTSEQVAAWLDGRDARVAPYPERLRTKGWRAYRRIRGARSTRGVFVGATTAEATYR